MRTVSRKQFLLGLTTLVVVQVVLEGHGLYTCNTNQTIICDCGNDDATTSSTSNVRHFAAPNSLPSTDSKDPSVTISQTLNSAAPEHTFSGKAVRRFPVDNFQFSSFASPNSVRKRARLDPWCEQWGVVTTNYEPSEAVRRWMRVEGWCLVMVGDRKSSNKYQTQWTGGDGKIAVVYLSLDDQKALNNAFVNAVPWNSFGRKNIGYLYAMMHGARVIWDFDDDNMLKFWIPGAAPKGAPSIEAAVPSQGAQTIHVLEPYKHNCSTYNPYPMIGAPVLPSWPRGLPLSHIKRPECYDTQTVSRKVSHKSVAVLQSLADIQPDTDVVYRITMPHPFSFKRSSETKPLMVPKGVFAPYNAQATLHFEASFWALLLPVTVHGRVSDIWRSYFAQRLFWDLDLRVGFLARPLVVHAQNYHSNLGDLEGERDLYQKSEHLVQFLGRWQGKGKTLIERIEELWVALYEHQYIEFEDVVLLQRWLQALVDVGYDFPELVKSPASWSSPINQPNTDKEEDKEDKDSCETATSLTFWTSDMHDGTRIDLPSALASMGHKVILAGRKRWKTPYPFVMNMTGISVYERLSAEILGRYRRNTTPLTEDMTIENFEFYKNDKKIASTDAFLCMFPASLCEMWMPFNKTIIVAPAHRYNLGRCTTEQWGSLNEHLQVLASMDNPKHIIAAESVYDQEYLRHYTGIDPVSLYSFSGFYTANNTYAPKRDEILAFGTWDNRLHTQISKVKIRSVWNLYPRYTLADLVSHRAVVYLPYAVMSYKLTELYSLCIPLFMPSMRFFRNIRRTVEDDRSSLNRWYCNNQSLDNLMKPHPSSPHPYSPNVDMPVDVEAEFYWLQLADFFQWPHITYFDDFRDLERKLMDADFEQIHHLMVEEVERKKNKLLLNLCKSSKKIQSGRIVPQDYHSAIQILYGVSRLQAI